MQVGKENLRPAQDHECVGIPTLPQRFLRISRSVIVNIDQNYELQPMFESESLVVLKNGKSYAATCPIREIQQKLEFY